ncbi:MAG TPA: GAF domain-containing protein [Candidatus Limnocylindrales bacterium]|nr:GAF domain-containing protein [Candidatus Limnocylindrales bacterium]
MTEPNDDRLPGDGDRLPGDGDRLPERAREALRAIVLRSAIAGRLTPPAGEALLRSIVEATVALFGAEAASLALHDAASDRLVFVVAAGSQGAGVLGLAIGPDQGVAGYVFTTGQPLALSDVERDARFGRDAAERTGYVPRSLVAVPLLDDEGTVGVLEVLDKRGAAGFDLRDVELASVFARQATVAIRASRLERDVRSLVGDALARIAADDSADAGDVEAIVADVSRRLDAEDDPLWALADEIARLRSADPAEIDLVRELLAVLVRRAERTAVARSRRRGRG